MSLQQFFEQLYLHDSVVDRLEYLPHEQKLTLSLDLCNYMQDGYQEGEPENIPGTLTFTEVSEFTTDPDKYHYAFSFAETISSGSHLIASEIAISAVLKSSNSLSIILRYFQR